MQPAAVLAAGAAPLPRPSDPPGLAVAGGHLDAVALPGRAGPRGVAGPPDAFGPRGRAVPPDGAGPPGAVGPPDGAAPLDASVLLGVVGPRGGDEPPDEAGPPGGAGPLVGSGHPDAFECPAACGHLDAAARHATELPHAAASPVSELPAFGLWLHHSEDSVGCQMWGSGSWLRAQWGYVGSAPFPRVAKALQQLSWGL